MPTYEYQCDHCGHEFELFQQMSDPVKRKCPACGRLKLRRLVGTGAGILFKGNGFYQTDYRSESYKKGMEAEKKASSDNGKKKDEKKGGKKESPAKSGEKSGGKCAASSRR